MARNIVQLPRVCELFWHYGSYFVITFICFDVLHLTWIYVRLVFYEDILHLLVSKVQVIVSEMLHLKIVGLNEVLGALFQVEWNCAI